MCMFLYKLYIFILLKEKNLKVFPNIQYFEAHEDLARGSEIGDIVKKNIFHLN